MRSVSKPWPERLLATLTMLVLVLAPAIGAYAHAAGHTLPSMLDAVSLTGASVHGGGDVQVFEAATPRPGHIGGAQDPDQTGHPHTDYCDTICHGGQAILAPDMVVPHPAHYVPLIQPAEVFDGAEPGGLERPPKTFRPA